jgi:hypothetical protein
VEISWLARRIPDDFRSAVLRAIATAVTENRPDALSQLLSPWKERGLAAWQPRPEKQPAAVVSLAEAKQRECQRADM